MGSVDRGMDKQLLDVADVGPALKKQSGEGVPEQMGMEVKRFAKPLLNRGKDVLKAPDGQRIAFGGEESGGFGYGMHIPERDGIFSSLLLLEMLSSSPHKKMSDYFQEQQKQLGLIYYDRIDLKYDQPNKNDLLPQLSQNRPQTIAALSVTDCQLFYSSRGIVNGIKFLSGPCRWLLIRSSETENIVRFYAGIQVARLGSATSGCSIMHLVESPKNQRFSGYFLFQKVRKK